MITMNFVCEKQSLYEAINNVAHAAAIKSTITALEGIKVNIKDNVLEFTGFDLELGIKTEITALTQGSGEFVINSRLFSDMIRKMPADTVTVTVDETLNTVIKGGTAEYNIICLSAEEYPLLPIFDKEKGIAITQRTLKNMINQTVFAVATSDNKPILTGELFEFDGNNFNLVGIDGYRLAIRTEKASTDEVISFVVPAKALREVAALLKEDDDKYCTLYTSRKHIIFDIAEYQVISRLLEGDFHNYKGSLPDASTTEVILSTRDFINSLERCALLINDRMKAPVRCIFDKGEVNLTCSTALGKVQDAFPIDHSGPAVEIGFNCKYLTEALKNTESDKVKLFLNGGVSPMKISPLEGSAYTFLVLPVRLK